MGQLGLEGITEVFGEGDEEVLVVDRFDPAKLSLKPGHHSQLFRYRRNQLDTETRSV